MDQPTPRTRLAQLAQRAHLSLADFVTRFHDAAVESGEGHVEISERQAKRWLAGLTVTPRPACRRILEHWWQEPVTRLLRAPDSDVVEVANATTMTEEELLMNAGREAIDHALNAATSTVDPSTLEQLHGAVYHAHRAYYTAPPWVMFTDLVRLRGIVYQLLDRTHKPNQKTELYLLAGKVCALLSSVCFELGRPDVAENHVRAAHTYGSLIDHPALCAWARYMHVYLMFSTGQPRQGASLAEAALEDARPGIARATLLSKRAHALALVGSRDEVRAEFDTASDELQRSNDTFLDDLNLERAFDPTGLAIEAGASFVLLSDGDKAESHCATALQLLSETPESERWIAGELAAWVDLAAARVLRDDLTGMAEALAPVFAVSPELRTEAIVRRLGNLGHMLSAARYRNVTEATRTAEAIEDFTARRIPFSTAE